MKKIVFIPFFLMVLLLISCSIIPPSIRSTNHCRFRFGYNNKYIVRKSINLRGDTLYLPANSTLLFKKEGSISDGIIVGNNSKIISEKKRIFKTVSIAGTWDIDTVYSEWFDFSQDSLYDNRNNFCNLTALSKGGGYTDIYMEEGVYWTTTQEYGYAIRLLSNTTWHCSATIKEHANSHRVASMIKVFRADNVLIDGGKYVGDLISHKGEGGEWSHGIVCMASSNVIIKNVECREFWGDGIDVVEANDEFRKPTLNSCNIKIFNANCYYNRRAGIGLEAVINCELKGCVSSFNGQKRGTLPMTGIGIESWNSENEKIREIKISDCEFSNNKNKDMFVYANGPLKEEFIKYDNNIQVKNCKIGNLFISYTNGIKLEGCDFSNSSDYEYVKGLEYVNCTSKGKRMHKIINYLPQKK